MTVDLRFAYANARIKGMKSNLLNAETVRKLLDVRTLDEVVAVLEETPVYKRDFVDASQHHRGIDLIQRALQAHVARVLRKVHDVMPPHAREALRAFYMEWEVQDVKAIASRLALGEAVSDADLVGLASHEKLVENARRAKTLSELAGILAREPAYASELAALAPKKTLAVKELVEAVDRAYYRNLVELAQGQDRDLRRVVAQRVEQLNALVALRMKKAGSAEAEIRKKLLSVAGAEAFARALAREPFDKALALAFTHFNVAEPVRRRVAEKNSLVPLEIALEKALVEKTLRASRLSVLSLGTVIGFLFLKNTEVQNIRKIALAKHFGHGEAARDIVFAINA